MTTNPENATVNQNKKDLSKIEKFDLLLKDLNDPAKISEKDDILGKMLSLILGDKKNKLGEVNADENPLKTRKEENKTINDDDKMMMALAFIVGAMAIAATGGVAGAAIIGGAPSIDIVSDLLKFGKSFFENSQQEIDENQSKIIGKSSLAFLLADKVKDNVLNFGNDFLNGDNNFVKSIGNYMKSLRGMESVEREKELNELKEMVKQSVKLFGGVEKNPDSSREDDNKINAIFAEFETMISKPKELEDPKNLISSLREIQVGNAIVSIESTTTTKKNKEEGADEGVKGDKKSEGASEPVMGGTGGDVPSTASSARSGGGTRAELAASVGRDASASSSQGRQ